MRKTRLLGISLLLGSVLVLVVVLVFTAIGAAAGGRSSDRVEDSAARPAPAAGVYRSLSLAEERWLQMHAGARSGDPAEAARRRRALSEALEHLAVPAAFRVQRVDCRATTCLARLVWADRGTAQERYRSVLHAPLDLPCARALFLHERVDPGPDYTVNLRLDCAAP